MDETKYFVLWQMDGTGEISGVGAIALLFGEGERLRSVKFHYAPDARRLDPRHDPAVNELQFNSDGRALPGFIDDCLPDDWGKKIIAARLKKRFLSLSDVVANAGPYASLGSLKILPPQTDPNRNMWDTGLDIATLSDIADSVWDGELSDLQANEAELMIVIRGGSQAGGARPKLIVSESTDNGKINWLVKFNRSTDRFNYARMEWACLELCRRAGLPVPRAAFVTLPSGRMGLKVERFDVSAAGGRYHLLTFNSLLKNEHDQDDSLTASYEDLVKMIRLYSDSPKADLRTLFGQMLINMAVRNTDDHLRNFSFISDGLGWRLSPVYDVVPNEDMATEHQLSCLRSHYLPSLTDALMAGKRCFGLGPSDANAVIENVCGAIQEWPAIVKEAGMNENDQAFALKVVSHIG